MFLFESFLKSLPEVDVVLTHVLRFVREVGVEFLGGGALLLTGEMALSIDLKTSFLLFISSNL